MHTTIGFATIGTSKITQKFLSAAKECEGFKLVAVYSRDIKKAEQFAGEQGAERFYDSLDMLAADKDVEAVYVASPNYMHYKHVMKLLKAGKHVFCEKAIASNHAEAEEMFRTAQERHLVLLEAVRPVFDPGMQAIKNNLYKLGAIRKANISYCQYSSRYDSFKEGQEHNIFSRECSAGALMDIGVIVCTHCCTFWECRRKSAVLPLCFEVVWTEQEISSRSIRTRLQRYRIQRLQIPACQMKFRVRMECFFFRGRMTVRKQSGLFTGTEPRKFFITENH